jgi:pilus assembly protein CpaB
VKTRMLTITLAVVLGLLGVVAVLAYVRQANVRAVNGLKAETVMTAAEPIPAGTSLNKAKREHLLGTEKVPKSSLSTPAVQSVAGTEGQLVLSANVPKGWVLLKNMLALASTVNSETGSSLAIPPGMIAVTVNMCVAEAVAEYPSPGSSVAVFDTIAGKGSQIQRGCDVQRQVLNSSYFTDGGADTLLVLPKAEVLAVGQNPAAQGTSPNSSVTVTNDPSSSSSSSSSDAEVLVTLAVHQADAQRLILMAEVGLPYLALLGPGATANFGGPVGLLQLNHQP